MARGDDIGAGSCPESCQRALCRDAGRATSAPMFMRCCPLSFVIVACLAGCGDDGRAARRADAIDVAGSWVEVRDDERPRAGLLLQSETSKNDVRAVLSRDDDDDALDVDEAAFLARVSNPNDRLAIRSALEVGAGLDAVRDEVDGGENVSFDGGATTSVRLVSVPFAATSDDEDVRVASQRWGLALDGDGDDLVGVLFVTRLEHKARAQDSDGVVSDAARHERPIALRRE